MRAGAMFHVPPIRDTQRDIRVRQIDQITQIEPVAPYPRIEPTGHPGDEPQRPEAVDERLRQGQRQREARRERGDDDGHRIDEFA